jgi:hypothetical protein
MILIRKRFHKSGALANGFARRPQKESRKQKAESRKRKAESRNEEHPGNLKTVLHISVFLLRGLRGLRANPAKEKG